MIRQSFTSAAKISNVLPITTAMLAAVIFFIDTITSLEIAVAVIIADVRMPEISGLALYGQLIASGHPIPTILITAYPDDAIRERALNAGVVAYLVKPFSEKEPLDSIEIAMKHKALRTPVKR